MNYIYLLTILILWHHWLLYMAKAVSLTIERVNGANSKSVNSCNYAMCAFANKDFRIDLVPCSDGWRWTWSQTINRMPGLLVPSMLQCELNCQEGASLELFQAIGRFRRTFIEAHQESNMICSVKWLKSQIKTCFFVEDFITSKKEIFKDFTFNIAVGISMLG